MKAVRKFITIEDPKNVHLSDLPFHVGQRVEVLMIAEEEGLVEEFRQVLKETQDLPEARRISDDEIRAEIANYRAGL